MPTKTTNATDAKVADATKGNWVDRYAPKPWRPYLRLARADRPIGTWLLLWPCWWSLALAAGAGDPGLPDIGLLVLFAVGAFVMRGAGCTFNDIVDRDIDGEVARTALRPIPSGAVTVRNAWIFLIAQCLVGLAVLLTLNDTTKLLGVASLGLVAIYPFMKRVTYWPQLFLGLAFNWGALMGWTAVTGSVSTAPVLLYLGGIAWTLGYDTIYAHQDKEDDALIGVKSTALKLGTRTKSWLWVFYGVAWSLFACAGWAAEMNGVFFVVLGLPALQLIWQIRRLDIDRPDLCLQIFKSNRDFGALVFVAILLGATI